MLIYSNCPLKMYLFHDISFPEYVVTEKIDLGFALSATALNARETFAKMKETVKSIIKKYTVGNLRYAVIVYGSDAKVLLSFERNFPALENWLSSVDNMRIEQGGPALEKALQKARVLFQSSGRKDAKKVLVVIADKSPIGDSGETGKEALELEYANVKIVPVAFGGDIDAKEIKDISPYKDVLVVVRNDVDPTDLGYSVMEKVLKGKPTPFLHTFFLESCYSE